MSDGYWRRFSSARLTRRRALGGAAGVGLFAAALSLIGCGGGGSKNEPLAKGGDKSGLLFTPQEVTGAAIKKGGVFKSVYTSVNPTSLDPHTAQTFTTLTTLSSRSYPRIFKFKIAKYPNFATGEIEGEVAESYELTPDKLQLTLKVRQGMKWDARAPTSNREIDAQDVVWNWKKFSEVGVRNGDLAYSEANPGSPVESVTAPDSKTVVIKMHAPDASLLQLFASNVIFYVLPREADGGFDSRQDIRGHGPYILEDYKASAFFGWKKNPDYYMKGFPNWDKEEQPHVVEYANRLAQFRAGNVWPSIGVTNEDIVPTKRDIPVLLMAQGEAYATAPTQISFGYEGDSPFKDKRMRQAVAFAVDRDLIIDSLLNRDKFAKDGLDLPFRRSTAIGPAWEGFWLDPEGDKFGPNAKYFKEFNPAESKKLIAAAGFPNGTSTLLHFVKGQYSATYEKTAEILAGFMGDVGLRAPATPHDYNTDYIPNYYYAYQGARSNGFSGMIYRAELSYPTCQAGLYGNIHKDGGRYRGLTPTGTNAKQGDPYLNSTIEKIKGEFDLKKAQEMTWDIQRYMADQAYYIPPTASSLGYTLQWPAIGNFGTYRTWGASGNANSEYIALYYFVDDTKPPLKSA